MSCGVGHRGGLDPALLWLERRLAATALIQPLAWKLPYVAGAVLKEKKYKTCCHYSGRNWHNIVNQLYFNLKKFKDLSSA